MQAFTQQLIALSRHRFALDDLSAQGFIGFRQTLLTTFEMIDDRQTWHLIGTDGCHLCEHIHAMLSVALPYHTDRPRLITLDLADSRDDVINALGTKIPLLLTPTRLFCYPFGIMDVLHHSTQKDTQP